MVCHERFCLCAVCTCMQTRMHVSKVVESIGLQQKTTRQGRMHTYQRAPQGQSRSGSLCLSAALDECSLGGYGPARFHCLPAPLSLPLFHFSYRAPPRFDCCYLNEAVSDLKSSRLNLNSLEATSALANSSKPLPVIPVSPILIFPFNLD